MLAIGTTLILLATGLVAGYVIDLVARTNELINNPVTTQAIVDAIQTGSFDFKADTTFSGLSIAQLLNISKGDPGKDCLDVARVGECDLSGIAQCSVPGAEPDFFLCFLEPKVDDGPYLVGSKVLLGNDLIYSCQYLNGTSEYFVDSMDMLQCKGGGCQHTIDILNWKAVVYARLKH